MRLLVLFAICVLISLNLGGTANTKTGVSNADLVCGIFVDFKIFLILIDKGV